jgi:hypothetical protein
MSDIKMKKIRTEVESSDVYLPELLVWLRNFFEAAKKLSMLLEIPQGELEAIVKTKNRFTDILFENVHICPSRMTGPTIPAEVADDLRRTLFQAIRFMVIRLKNHPAMTSEHYYSLGLDRPECRFICKEYENSR